MLSVLRTHRGRSGGAHRSTPPLRPPLSSEENDDRFYVAKSALPKARRGLFARVPLAKNEIIEVIGILVRAGSVADQCTSYANSYKFRVGRYLLIPTGYGGMANHSPTPNMVKMIRGSRIYLRTLRRIKKGEELLHAYNKHAKRFARTGARGS
jgi:SET domain-containing protein